MATILQFVLKHPAYSLDEMLAKLDPHVEHLDTSEIRLLIEANMILSRGMHASIHEVQSACALCWSIINRYGIDKEAT